NSNSTATEQNEYSNLVVDLSASKDLSKILSQSWEHEDDLESLKGMDDASTIEIPFRSFYFFSDGTFLKNPRNAIDYGTWVFDNVAKTITLNYQVEKGKNVYKIAALAADELKLVNKSVNSSTILKFIGLGKSFVDPTNDPYHISNNQWRLHPKKKETDIEIQNRLKANLHFFVLFYRNAIAKNATTASTWGLPSCLKFYGGGIYITKKEALHEGWMNCFYNKDQAMKAYEIMDKVIGMKYKWPKDEPNWMKQNLTVLEQMEKNVAELK
ncbi:MAG: hypothetical protein WCG67_10080, partial [Ferruginibacter sp.]